jgi:hypothetical protein
MITCPNCGKQNADEAVHCGFCGHQLQEGGKKTMFGMAALDPEALKRAAEEAKLKKEQEAAASLEKPAPLPKLDLPKLGGASLNLPKPNSDPDPFGATEMMSAVSPAAKPPTNEPDPFADAFAELEANYGKDFPSSAPSPADDDAGAPTELTDTSDLMAELAAGGAAPVGTPMFQEGVKPAASDDPFAAPPSGDPFAPPAGDPFAAPPSGDPFAASSPSSFANDPYNAPTKPAPVADPFAANAGGGAAPANNLPMNMPGGEIKKKDNTMLYIGLGLLFVGGGGCVVMTILGYFLFG